MVACDTPEGHVVLTAEQYMARLPDQAARDAWLLEQQHQDQEQACRTWMRQTMGAEMRAWLELAKQKYLDLKAEHDQLKARYDALEDWARTKGY